MPVDRQAVSDLLELATVQVIDEAHLGEHALEVHLPFLQQVLRSSFAIVPLLVGDATIEEVAEVLEMVWGGAETLIVVSSDLSHFLDYEAACRVDGETAEAIQRLAPEAIGTHQACGSRAIGALLRLAQRHGLRARTIDLRNSGDTAGDRDRVVGYGAFVFA